MQTAQANYQNTQNDQFTQTVLVVGENWNKALSLGGAGTLQKYLQYWQLRSACMTKGTHFAWTNPKNGIS